MSAYRPAVLLIDADPEILQLMGAVFSDAGMEVVACPTPEQGLAVITERRVSCVLLDLPFARTPECLGFLQALRAYAATATIPVFVTSAMVAPEMVSQVLDLGARKFIPKPFYPGEVLREVRSACF